MIVIGEKINGAIPSVAEAISNRDSEFIKNLVKIQEDAGVDYLDICAGTKPDLELDALIWLVDIVQSCSTTPICLDSPDALILKEVMPLINRPGILNSTSLEGNKCEILYPLLQGNSWSIIALTCNDIGIPQDSKTKINIASDLIKKAAQYGIVPERIYIDPLVLSLSAVNNAALDFIHAIEEIKKIYPTVNIIAALSNISYGMPYRALVNQNFLTLALASGLDSAIIDPTNKYVCETILATKALLNKDRLCRNYLKAYRSGKIGKK